MKRQLLTIFPFLLIFFTVNAQLKQKPVQAVVKNSTPITTLLKTNTTTAAIANTNGLTTLQWEKPHTESIGNTGTTKVFIGFKGATYDAGMSYLPVYFKRIKLNSSTNKIKVVLENETYISLSADETAAINKNKAIGADIKLSYNLVADRMQPYAQLSILPIRKNASTGQFEKLVSFKISVQESTEIAGKRLKKASFASSSVLSGGTWYKIGVTADGVYKLDYNFLKNLGYNMASLVPANIRIYGNGGKMLPTMNNAPRPDDLMENAVFVQGNSDASFQQNDYVLFYGQSPHTWALDTTGSCAKYHHTVNLYSDTTYYFINADMGAGKRIAVENSLPTATDTVKSFDDYAYVEPDQTNLIQSGNQWFGQYFDVTTSYNIPFNFSNILTSSPVYVNTYLASRYDISNGTTSLYTASAGSGTVNISCGSVSTNIYFGIYATMGSGCFSFTPTSSSFDINVSKITPGAIGWLYYIEVNLRRPLSMPNDQMEFRDALSVGKGKVSLFDISTFSPLQVWDISNPQNVLSVTLNNSTAGHYQYTLASDTLKQYMAFTGNKYLTAIGLGKVANQNLHASAQVDLIIVANPQFYSQAMQLAAFHRTHDSLSVQVVTTTQVYNEFSSGRQDPVAIRDFCRMFYSRQTSYANSIKYLLLYGDGSYDPKNRMANNSNFVVTYESDNSFDPTGSYVTDDFYAVLEDTNHLLSSPVGNLDLSNYTLDIGVGRLTVDNASEAQTVLNKIINYETNSGEPVVSPISCCNPQTQYNMGNWRNTVCFIAHDGDADIHVDEAETLADSVANDFPNLNVNKIYLDAYQMIQTPGGPRYPDVNTAIDNQMNKGLLIINYTGHGGQLGLAVSRVLTFNDIYSWTNINKLSLFFTASCEFARFDDPEQISAGELCLQSSTGGNIALMTTVRDVYSGGNALLNQNFFSILYTPLPDGSLPRLGDLFTNAKNLTGPIINSRMFALLGDPAVRLAYPKNEVYTSTINSVAISANHDTLKALAKVTVTGYVGDKSGNTLSGFNGVLYPTIYDKPTYEFTLGNLGGVSPIISFKIQKNIVFNGRVSVTNGKFSFGFVVPKDIQYNYGFGKISYYAQNGSQDATGSYDSIIVGGSSPTAFNNGKGPQVRLYMNDSNFAYGGMTNETPQIFAIITDSNGINTSGSSIGHDITAVLDNNTQNTIDLNQYYQPALNSYQRGTVTYPLSSLSPGTHSLSIRVWNVYNNTTQSSTEFTVEPKSSLQLQHVLNYPNPFTTFTEFFFELNEVCDQLNVQIQIFTVSGKLVKNIVRTVKTDSFRSQPIDWDGKDDYGDKIAKGVYIYHVKVRTNEGTTTDSYQKLVIL